MKNNIILVGFMGSGKSSVGKALAEDCNMTFLDTDAWIERKHQITISEIFATKGEEYFRESETKCLEELLLQDTKKAMVISVGGGLPVRDENRQLLKRLGKVWYLKATEETIYQRLKSDTTRPLLQGENPRQKIKDLMNNREDKYLAAADNVILVDEKTISQIVDEIKQSFNN